MAVAVIASLLELLCRLVFPRPEVSNFDRLWYVNGRTGTSSYVQAKIRWQSQPDGAAFVQRTNLYGFRGPDWRMVAPPSSWRIGVFGDSFVEGSGVPDRSTIPVLLGRSPAAGEGLWDLLNLGIGGVGLEVYLPLIRDAVRFFEIDEVLLILYVNDFYSIPDPVPLLARARERRVMSRSELRILEVIKHAREGTRVPRIWHTETRLQRTSELHWSADAFVEPELAAMMRAGTLNSKLTNLLARSCRVLPRRSDIEQPLRALSAHLANESIGLRVVYLPSLNQVSDAYLEAQRKLSRPVGPPTLTTARFQQQERDLLRACARLDIPCLSLRPAFRELERRGIRLYWPYDSHLRPTGARHAARIISEWMRGDRTHL